MVMKAGLVSSFGVNLAEPSEAWFGWAIGFLCGFNERFAKSQTIGAVERDPPAGGADRSAGPGHARAGYLGLRDEAPARLRLQHSAANTGTIREQIGGQFSRCEPSWDTAIRWAR